MISEMVTVPTQSAVLTGDVVVPGGARAVVLFAHGSGSSRLSPRNRAAAADLHKAGLGTLLLDLLSEREEREDAGTAGYRFTIPLLAERLVAAIDWLSEQPDTAGLPVGLFGAGTGGAAALVAAAERPERVYAVVSRGGRPDLAGEALQRVAAPVLFLVGSRDQAVVDVTRQAAQKLSAPHRTRIVQGATHLFPEPGAMEEVTAAAGDWFLTHLRREKDDERSP